MSTYWYFECLDHTPPLRSADEFTQHTGDRHYDRGVAMLSERPVEPDTGQYWSLGPTATDQERLDAYFDGNARGFLTHHPTCRVGVVNEYGDRYNPERGDG